MVADRPALGSVVHSLVLSRKAHEEQKQRKLETQERLRQHALQVHALRDIYSLIDEDRDGVVGPADLRRTFGEMGLEAEATQQQMDLIFPPERATMSMADFVTLVYNVKPVALRKLIERARMYREMFALFDRDGSGEMTAQELGTNVTKLFGWRPTRYELERMLASVDEDGDNFITFSEFVKMMTDKVRKDDALDRIKQGLHGLNEMFKMFDVDSQDVVPDFKISITEFGKVMRSLGNSHENEEIESMFAEIDRDGGGQMEFAEFADFITGPETQVRRMVEARCGELKGLFRLFDEDSGGSVSLEELAQIMRKLGRRPSEDELSEAFFGVAGDCGKEFDIADIELDFVMFVQMMVGTSTKTQRCLQKQLCDFREAFDLFDEDGGGTVDLDEFVSMMETFGHVAVDAVDLKATVAEFDTDCDGELNFVDFLGMMVSDDPVVRRDIKSHLVGFREAFNLFDSLGSGVITTESFLYSWREYGFTATDEQVIEMLRIADTDGSGEIEFDEFVQMVAGARSSLTDQIRSQLSELREIFSLFDPDGDGTITNDEIGEVLRRVVGMDITDAEVQLLTSVCDEDGNGEIDFAEFAGMMAKNHNPNLSILGLTPTPPPLGPAIQVLKQDPETRGSEDIKKVERALESVGIDFFGAKGIDTDVSRELCRQMAYRTFKPYQTISKQFENAMNYVCVLSGSALCWRRCAEKWNETLAPAEEIKDLADPELPKKVRAKAVAARRGSIPGPLQELPPPKAAVQYEASVWCSIEKVLKETMRHVRTAIKEMPSNTDTPEVKKLTEMLSITATQLFSWICQGQEAVVHDLDDMRSYINLLQDGATTLETLHKLYLHADKVRREQLLVKFHVQLSTYASDQVNKMEAPFSEEQADEYITTLEEENAAFLVASARSGHPIIQCSQGFTDLTGYTRDDTLGKNARLLHGKGTNAAISDQIKRHLKSKRNDLTVLIDNYKKDGTMFVNKLYLAPVIEDQGRGRVLRWIGVLCDATTTYKFYAIKPIVQGIINVCKFLINVLRKTLEVLGPPFGSPDWGTKLDKAALRRAVYEHGCLHPDDEYLGEIETGLSCGDQALQSEPTKAEVLLIAGKHGCKVALVTRQMWLQAHAMEPVRFLKSIPMFAHHETTKLQRVATMMVQRSVHYHHEIVNVGDLATTIYLIKQGEVELQVRVDPEGKPLPPPPHVPESNEPPLERKKRRGGGKSQAIALIGCGDAISEAVEVAPGILVHTQDAVATTDDVVIYEVPRAALEKLGPVHSTQLERERASHRHSYINSIPRATEDIRVIMKPPEQPPLPGEDLGWEGYGRLPEIRQSSPSPKPGLHVETAEECTLPQITSPNRLLISTEGAPVSFSRDGRWFHEERCAAISHVAQAEHQRRSDGDKMKVAPTQQISKSARMKFKQVTKKRQSKRAAIPNNTLVTWSGGDSTQIVCSKVQNNERILSPKESSGFADLFDVGPVEAELRGMLKERVKAAQESKPTQETAQCSRGDGSLKVQSKRGSMKVIAETNRLRLQELKSMVESLENRSNSMKIEANFQMQASTFEIGLNDSCSEQLEDIHETPTASNKHIK